MPVTTQLFNRCIAFGRATLATNSNPLIAASSAVACRARAVQLHLRDRNQVTFVSVTQSFNTTTSMGRLTLNVLLSFAQFEREVIGERIRDKFAASRRKGMWMGGWAPLGYDIKDRKLIINEPEAKLVQSIFRRFARGLQPQLIIEQLAEEGALNKNGKPIDKGYLYRILHNRVYLGEAIHKGTSYPGEHEPIVEKDLWDQVHALITASLRARTKRPLGRTPALLKGLIFGPTGTAMTRRIAAAQIETVVIEQLKLLLQSPEVIVATWRAAKKTIKGITEHQVADEIRRFDELWSELFPAEQARIIQLLVARVDISEDGADITLKVDGLSTVLNELGGVGGRREAA